MTKTTDNSKDLTAEQQHFSRLIAKGYTKTKAYREAFPQSKGLTNNTVRAYASDLSMKPQIITEVQTTREKQARLARLAETRIEEFLTEVKPNRTVADVAMFMYDHANGKATIKAEIKSAHVSVTYDLSGGQAGDVPPEVLAQLNQA